MKLHILSDLHTEIGPYSLKAQDFDVLILAGDIGTGMNGLKSIQGLKVDKPIIYLAGNHEYYRHAFPHITNKIRAATDGTNIHFLERDSLVIDGIRFLGTTMWTDFNLKGDVLFSEYHAKANMNDYRKIRISPTFRKVLPSDLRLEHIVSVKWLAEQLLTPFDGKTVVITHHAPSAKSLEYDDIIGPAYASNLERFMGPNVPLWIHGHTHYPVDYTVDGTRVISNPRGYHGEGIYRVPAGFNPELIVEIWMSDIPKVEEMVFTYCVLGSTWGKQAPNPETKYPGSKGGFVVQYGVEKFGFGEVTFAIRMNGTLECDSECCSPAFVKRVMQELVKRALFVGLTDNKHHDVPDTAPEIDDKNQHGARGDEPEYEFEEGEPRIVWAPDTIKKIEPPK